MKNKGGFFKSNWAYLIWFIFYFSVAVITVGCFVHNTWLSILITALIYGGCIGLALSPIGESVVRLMEGANPILTQEDKDYLLPLFEEVYEEAKNFSPNINKDIKLYITDSMSVNAFAVGRKTVAVTRGAISAFTKDELKGVLAHELGHMANGDTKALLIKLVGNGFFSLIILVLRLILNIIHIIPTVLGRKNIIILTYGFIAFLAKVLFEIVIFATIFFGDVIIALNSRYSEYLADEYAYLIGFGDDLKNALYLLSKISLPRKISLTERLKSSHPYISARIERLENLQEQTA